MCHHVASRLKLLEFTKYEDNWVNQPRLQKTITENNYSTSLLDSDWCLLIATALKAKCKAFLKLSISIQTSSMWTMRHFCVVLGLQHEKQKKKKGLEKRPQGTGVHVTQDIPQLRLQKSPIHHNKEILKFSNNNQIKTMLVSVVLYKISEVV